MKGSSGNPATKPGHSLVQATTCPQPTRLFEPETAGAAGSEEEPPGSLKQLNQNMEQLLVTMDGLAADGADSRSMLERLFVCLLAGYVEWHLRRAVAPLLFDDETLEEARATRDPVAAAKPTPCAQYKKARRRTDDGLALHSLETLIAELATRCRNTCRVQSDPTAPAFSLLTEPTETQRRVAQLIEMFQVPAAAGS